MLGTRLGPYEIIEEIGKGGMATVFRAYQPSIGRYVAIKIIHRAIATDDRAVERFQREARLIARLEHPHLLPVYDYDGTHEPPYIVMRYLEGGTLKDVLDRSALPLVDSSYLLRQLASALDYAHRQGVIHRDIKPSNIMIDIDGNGFLMDFGIARLATSGEGLTQTGFAVGTPGYMAPEQGMGMDNIDHRADIYALGVMVYQMITGQMPYSAETPLGVVMKHINDPVPSVRALNPQLPELLDAALMRAMAKKPEDRFDTATDFADELTRAVGRLTAGNLRPETLRRIARENVDAIYQRRAQNQTSIDAVMASFEASRASATRARPAQSVDPDMPTLTEIGAVPSTPGTTPSPTPGATPYGTPPPSPAAPPSTPPPGSTPPGTQTTARPLGGIYGRLTAEDAPAGTTPPSQPVIIPAPPAPPANLPPPAAAPPAGRSRLPLILGGMVAIVAIGVVLALAIGSGSGGLSEQDLTATPAAAASAEAAQIAAQTATQLAFAPVETTPAATRTPLPVRATATAQVSPEVTARPTEMSAEVPTGTPAETATTAPIETPTELVVVIPVETTAPAPSPTIIAPTATVQPTATESLADTPTPVATEVPSATPAATLTSSPTLTPPPTSTPTPEAPVVIASRQLSVRLGPGSLYPVVGQIEANTPVDIQGVSDDGLWYLVTLDSGGQGWLGQSPFVTFGGDLNAVPFAEGPTDTPSPTATNTPTRTPTETFTPSATPTEVPTETPTPTPTDTAIPTATEVPTRPPTATLKPTNTEVPTPESTIAPPTETPAPVVTLVPPTEPLPSATAIPAPQAAFTWAIAPENALSVQFIDQSTGGVTAYRWDFGDGSSSSARNPAHVFPAGGDYTVTLEVGGFGGSTSATQILMLAGSAGPTAATATATPTEGGPVPTQAAADSGAFPFIEDFQGADSVANWDFDASAWQVISEGGESFLAGQGSLRQPVVVMGRATPAWLDPDVSDLVIRMRFNLDAQAAGARIAWHYSSQGYRVLELYPGLVILRRNAPTPDVFTREPERILQTISAPIQGGQWYDVMIWSSGSRVYVYLDGELLISAQDSITPALSGGQILLQVNNQSRPIRFDDLEIMRPDPASTSFAGSTIPDNWTGGEPATVSVTSDGALRMQGVATVTPQVNAIGNMLLVCSMWSDQGGYIIRLREGPDGAIQLRADGGNLWVERLSPDGSAASSEQVANFYNRGRWELITAEMIGDHLTLSRDGTVRYDGAVDGAPPEGGVSFTARTSSDIFKIDYCFFSPTAGVSNVDSRPYYAERERALARPFRELRSDFSDDFADIFRTQDWWQDGQRAQGAFQIDPSSSDHQRYIQMINTGRPTWRLMRDVIGVEVFESGSSLAHSTDIYTSVEVRFPEDAPEGTAWLMARALPTITGADLQGYRLDLTKNSDGTLTVTARFISPTHEEVFFEGPVPAAADGSPLPAWTTLEILTLDNKVSYFVNGVFVAAADGSLQLGGTMALGVEANTTANFDSVIVRDTSPHDE